MDIILALLGLFFLSYQSGKNNGKWGCFTILLLFFFVASIILALK